MSILGVDLSHYQSADFGQIKASGRDFVVLKATEGTTYVDPTFAARRQQAHAAGLVVGIYHFARAGAVAAEVAWFLRTVGGLQPGEFLVLDWEVASGNPPAWCKQWLDGVHAATGVRPLIYMNQSAATGSNWSAVTPDYGLWLAKYDNSTAQPSVGAWSVVMKQYSDKGSVPGVGACDVDVFYGSTAQLLAYGSAQEDSVATIDDVYNLLMRGHSASNPGDRIGDLWLKLLDIQSILTGPGGPRADGSDRLTDLYNELKVIEGKIGQPATVDASALASAVVSAMGTEFAQKVIDALGQRIQQTQPPAA